MTFRLLEEVRETSETLCTVVLRTTVGGSQIA